MTKEALHGLKEKTGMSLEVRKLEASKASEFYQQNPHLLHGLNRPDFLETQALAWKRELLFEGVYDQGDLVAVAPLLVRKVGLNVDPLNAKLSPGSPIRYIGMDSKDPERILDQMEALRKEIIKPANRIGEFHFTFPPDVGIGPEDFAGSEFKAQMIPTAILPLVGTSAEEILKNANAQTRTRERVKQGLRKITIKDATERNMKDHMYNLEALTYEHTGGTCPYPKEMPSLVWDRHQADPNFFMKTAFLNDDPGQKPVGMLVAIRQGDTLYSLWYAKDYGRDDIKNVPVQEALIAKMAEEAAGLGIKNYDLGGGSEGIMAFKNRMGAETVDYAVVDMTHGGLKFARKAWHRFKH